jgi:hypothetical protein
MQSLTDLMEAFFIKCDVSKVPMKAMVEKNHSYFGRLIMPLTMPVLKEILHH